MRGAYDAAFHTQCGPTAKVSSTLTAARRACLACAAMTARDALHVAVQGGCKNLGRDDLGQIAPGFAADIVAFPTNKLAFAGAQHDVVAALIFCSPGADQVPHVLHVPLSTS